ncbi:hypothetical protein Pyrde_0655 [Pyrodictium delaneyi]|uniref:KaiC domain-containing protein n=1 Tax=Pyrodictium delaneyi TaxID=1273541 RepID=A0A0N7JCY7_9CREN|nr:ATPase domain-containing protein [Pyrodictium delaneyi]ALL00705.1 hypothetical protein Pyrde_0655 [Pyrodictium delaneyi]
MGKKSDTALIPLGISGLDEALGGGVRPGSVILVAGAPGSGKTSFAARFIYEGLTKFNQPSVYLSFNEYKEEFYENMANLGLDFQSYESKGKFIFIEALNINDDEAVMAILENLLTIINTIKAKRVAIDTITSLLQILGSAKRARELLHSLFIHYMKKRGITTVLTAELPIGDPKLGYGIEEFIADGLIILRTKFSGDKIVRIMEIRKMRGHRATLARLTYAIVPGKVIAVRTPPRIIDIHAPQENLAFQLETGDANYSFTLPRGAQVLVAINPVLDPLSTLFGIACKTRIKPSIKLLYRTFTRSPEEIQWVLKELKCKNPTIEFVHLSSINPTLYSVTELAMMNIEEDLAVKPDIVVIDGIEQAFWLSGGQEIGIREHYNNIQYRKIHNITGVYVYTITLRKLLNANPLLNIYDAIFYFTPRRVNNKIHVSIRVIKSRYKIPTNHITLPIEMFAINGGTN